MDFATSYTAVTLASGLALYGYFSFRPQNLRNIPTVGGSSDPLLSYIGAYKLEQGTREALDRGYALYSGRAFKIPLMGRWQVILPGMVEEIRRYPDDKMSFNVFSAEAFNMRYCFGDDIVDDPYHIELIRDKLTKSLSQIFPAIHDEVQQTFADEVGDASDWTAVSAQKIFMTIVARASNRAFVGLPLCRNADYLKLFIQFTIKANVDNRLLTVIPSIIKPLVGRLITKVPSTTNAIAEYLKPVVSQRLEEIKIHGEDDYDRPNDMLQWILETSKDSPRATLDAITRRMMIVNFGAIDTTSNTIMHAVYQLAACPEWADVLREEVERVTETDGWTKVAMNKMHKVDSFLRESARFNVLIAMTMSRVALQDTTLSSGDFIPKGTFVAAPATNTHFDDKYYDNATVFDPWRFSKERETAAESAKHQFVNTNSEYLVFGHGKHACPGRFFAANELKLMLSHLVTTYDIKLPGDSRVKPPSLLIGAVNLPDPDGKICLRVRKK